MTRGSSGRLPVSHLAPGVVCLGPWGRTQTNVHLVRSADAWVLVDAGWASDADRIDAATRSVVGSDGPPVAIVVTHVHPDHSGAALALARRWHCPVLMHPDELPIATGDIEAMSRWAGPLDRWVILPSLRALGPRRRERLVQRESLAEVAQTIDVDAGVQQMPDWRCVPTPGHTPGHLSYVRPSDGVLISGDALLTLAVNHWSGLLLGRQGLSGPPWYTTWDRAAALRSVRTLAGLGPSVVAPGHGRPRSGPHTAERVRAFADHLAR